MTNPEPSVVQDQHKWTVYNSKVNLPAALNDPRLVKRETDFFTKTWGVDFYEKSYLPSSPYVQEINRGHFQGYINRTSEVIYILRSFQLKETIKKDTFVVDYLAPINDNDQCYVIIKDCVP